MKHFIEKENVVIYLTGIPCSGKTTFSKVTNKRTKLPVVVIDYIYNKVVRKYNDENIRFTKNNGIDIEKDIEMGYKETLEEYIGKSFIMEGFYLGFEKDRRYIEKILGEHTKIFINIVPNFNLFNRYSMSRHHVKPKYITYMHRMNCFSPPDYFYYTVDDWCRCILDLTIYQNREDVIKRLNNIPLPEDLSGYSIMDIGCAEGMFGELCLARGAEKVSGIDINITFLEQARLRGMEVYYDDINISDFNIYDKYDYVIVMSALHRFTNIPHALNNISKITKKMAVIEVPISPIEYSSVLHQYSDIEGHNATSIFGLCPSKKYIELWLKKYFKHFECIGDVSSKYYDDSKRVMYLCYN